MYLRYAILWTKTHYDFDLIKLSKNIYIIFCLKKIQYVHNKVINKDTIFSKLFHTKALFCKQIEGLEAAPVISQKLILSKSESTAFTYFSLFIHNLVYYGNCIIMLYKRLYPMSIQI